MARAADKASMRNLSRGLLRQSVFRVSLAIVGLLLLAAAWQALAPGRWLSRIIPLNTAGTAFNLSLLAEVRASVALLGVACLLIALLGRRLLDLTGRLAPFLAAADRWLRTGRRWSAILLVATAAMAAAFAAYSITRHLHFNSKAYDLGLHAQVWWNTAHGRLFASSVEVDNYLGDHVSPIILLLAPLYRLWPDPRLLLILQAVALAAGTLPLAWLARRLLSSDCLENSLPLRAWLRTGLTDRGLAGPAQAGSVARRVVASRMRLEQRGRAFIRNHPDGAYLTSLLLALIYLTYPALGFVNRFEFHEEVLAVPLLLLAFWWLETERPGLMSLALFLALLCKEDVGLTIAAFGLFVWYRKRHLRATGLAWTVAGLAWSLLALFVVIPAFRGGAPSDTLGRYAWLGAGPADILSAIWRDPALILRHLLGEPRRLWFLAKFLLPVGFLPLLSPAILVALPALAVNWLAGNLYQASIYFHYATLLIPVVFAAAAYGLARATNRDPHTHTLAHPPTRTPAHPPTRTPAHSHTRRPTLLLLWLLFCAVLALAFDQPWQAEVGPADWENYGLEWQVTRESVAAFQEAATLLPAAAAVATTEAYAPYLANRQGLYLLHDPRILRVADRVNWVLVDLNDYRYGVNPKLYYGLLRWIADRRGLRACYFADDVVLLGPDCADPSAVALYRSRMADLQRSAATIRLEPALIKAIGPQYFAPLSGQR